MDESHSSPVDPCQIPVKSINEKDLKFYHRLISFGSSQIYVAETDGGGLLASVPWGRSPPASAACCKQEFSDFLCSTRTVLPSQPSFLITGKIKAYFLKISTF